MYYGLGVNALYSRLELEGSLTHCVHYVTYRLKRRKTPLAKAMLIVSVDVDVGNRNIGVINEGKNDSYVHDRFNEYTVGAIEEQVLPLVIDFFNALDIPVTFGIRGQSLEADTSFLDKMLESHVPHDIGSHSYYHRNFLNLSCDEAENDLRLVSAAMKKSKVVPRSFIFPRNGVAHLEVLRKFGYKCYRGYGDFRRDDMCINKQGELYDIHPGLYIGNAANPFLAKKIIDLAVKNKLPLHMWFHLWNLGNEEKSAIRKINRLFFPIFKQAKSKEKKGLLEFETMLSAAEKN